jgi:hypothetical protein
MAKGTKAEQQLAAAERVADGAQPTMLLEHDVPKGADVVVEVATPLETISYDMGDSHGGKINLRLPVPPPDSLLRIVTVAPKSGKRELVHSETLK